MKNYELNRKILPVLAMRGLVVFPKMLVQIDVARKKSVMAIESALEQDRDIFLATQRDLSDSEPSGDDVFDIGLVAKVKQVIHSQNGILKVHLEGVRRAEIVKINQESPFLIAEVENCESLDYKASARTEAITRIAHERFEEYIRWFKNVPSDILIGVLKEKECGALADFMTANIALEFEQKQIILDELHPVKRLEKLNSILFEEVKVLKVESEITLKTQMQMDENHREYILREQMKAIASELGEDANSLEETEEFKEKIYALGLSEESEKKMITECDRLQRMSSNSPESSVIRTYIETCLSLPWKKYSREKNDINKAQRILDRDHFGLEKVKERFVELMAVRKLKGSNPNSQIVCLVGPPGVGKTSVAKSVAEATGRKYARVSLGGIQDVADIMGHRKTYVGAMMGRIMAAMKQAGTKNPLILLDEIDKLGQSFRGDPSSSLLEVLDPEQNKTFHDHYIDLPFDLSEVLFITTANDPSSIPSPLYDRMDVINLGSYTSEEKVRIGTKYLFPKQLKAHGISPKMLKISKDGMNQVIENYTREAGVRTLERRLAEICRKVARKIVGEEDFQTLTIKSANLEEYLGAAKFSRDKSSQSDEVGLVNGLAWTSVGGELLPIEVAVMDGKGKIQLTGSLGDVMKESASASITCIRTMADKLGINPAFYEQKDIHIHAPEGAIPKDGPSAGVAMSVAITSALTGIPIKHNVAMTGEITLQGRVLPIGGLKEKAMAAYKNGIDTVLIPFDNVPNLEEVDEVVKQNVKFVPLKRLDTALEYSLVDVPKKIMKNNPKKED
ncbi:MAG: endopeptidase La [Clostridia bacterium]